MQSKYHWTIADSYLTAEIVIIDFGTDFLKANLLFAFAIKRCVLNKDGGSLMNFL